MISLMFYYLGLVLVLFSWACGAYLLARWHDRDFATISKHAASTGQSYWLFVGTLVGIGSLFFAWAFKYLVPQSSTKAALTALLALSLLLQAVTAIVPDRPGWQRTVHKYGAWGMAVSWLPLTFLIGLSSSLPAVAHYVCLALPMLMLVMFGLLPSARVRRHFLLFQATYITAFQLSLLAAVYL